MNSATQSAGKPPASRVDIHRSEVEVFSARGLRLMDSSVLKGQFAQAGSRMRALGEINRRRPFGFEQTSDTPNLSCPGFGAVNAFGAPELTDQRFDLFHAISQPPASPYARALPRAQGTTILVWPTCHFNRCGGIHPARGP